AYNFIYKLKAFINGYIIILFVIFFKICEWANFKLHIGKFTATAGLLLIYLTMFNAGGNGFSVGDLRSTNISFYFKLTAQSLYNNLQVKLAHSGNRCLTGLLIGFHF